MIFTGPRKANFVKTAGDAYHFCECIKSAREYNGIA